MPISTWNRRHRDPRGLRHPLPNRPPMTEAQSLNERGRAALDEARLDDALQDFRRAQALAPEWSVPWFNEGLVHKRLRGWDPCLAAQWNAGIAAPNEATLRRHLEGFERVHRVPRVL